MESLKEKTAKGLFWGGMNNAFQQLLGFLIGIITARILSPADYGMVAMISIFSLVANALQESGFRNAIVNLKEATDNDYNSVFWFNILMGCTLYVTLFFCAPLIAEYYHNEKLIPLCRYAFLGFVFSSFGIAQAAYLFRNLQVKQQAKSGMAAVVVSNLVGVTLAWLGFSYWAIATQNIVFVAVNTALLWYYSAWRPSFRIDFGPVKRMFRFSCKLLATNILKYVNDNVLNILLGRYFSPRSVGNYNQAYQWSTKGFFIIQGMLLQVAQPVFSDANDERERQLRILRKMMRFSAFLSFPLMFGISLVSHEFIIVTITEKWESSAVLLQLLCISGAFVPLCTLMSNLIISRGRSDIFMWCTLILGVVQITLMISLYPYGIHTMVEANVALNIFWVSVWMFFVKRLTGYGYLMMIKDILPFLLAAVAVMLVTHFVTLGISSQLLLLLTRIVIAAVLYYLIMKMAGVAILDECTSFILSTIKKKRS